MIANEQIKLHEMRSLSAGKLQHYSYEVAPHNSLDAVGGYVEFIETERGISEAEADKITQKSKTMNPVARRRLRMKAMKSMETAWVVSIMIYARGETGGVKKVLVEQTLEYDTGEGFDQVKAHAISVLDNNMRVWQYMCKYSSLNTVQEFPTDRDADVSDKKRSSGRKPLLYTLHSATGVTPISPVVKHPYYHTTMNEL